MPAELILIGGTAILANYGFQEMTSDVDAIIRVASSMKDAVNRVGDKFDLPNGWLNADFQRTDSQQNWSNTNTGLELREAARCANKVLHISHETRNPLSAGKTIPNHA